MYDLLIFIGRFQPLHRGHQEVIERARELAKNVLVLIGSAGIPRSTRNPFTYEERATLIKSIYPDVITKPIHDHTYNDSAWITEVQTTVKQTLLGDKWQPDGLADYKIGLIGCEKDHTSYYLKMFPDWLNESVQFVNPLNATAFRKEMFESKLYAPWEEVNLHRNTYSFLQNFMKSQEFVRLTNEYEYLKNYKHEWGEGPFLTADSLVQVGGKILLVTRGKEYGSDLLALPGGFINKYERFYDGAIRELREETRLRVPIPVLGGSLVSSRVFDDPHRSERGRIVTVCHHFKLENDVSLPEVRGHDDAKDAAWYDISDLTRANMFEDHYYIIHAMLGING